MTPTPSPDSAEPTPPWNTNQTTTNSEPSQPSPEGPPTPRTDALAAIGEHAVWTPFARILENELAEAKAESSRWRGKELNAATEAARQGIECTDLRQQLAAVTAERDAANGWLDSVRARLDTDETGHNLVGVAHDAHQAELELSALRTESLRLREDGERLDWLEAAYSAGSVRHPEWWNFDKSVANIGYRAAIDAAKQRGGY